MNVLTYWSSCKNSVCDVCCDCCAPPQTFIRELVAKLEGVHKQEELQSEGIEHPVISHSHYRHEPYHFNNPHHHQHLQHTRGQNQTLWQPPRPNKTQAHSHTLTYTAWHENRNLKEVKIYPKALKGILLAFFQKVRWVDRHHCICTLNVKLKGLKWSAARHSYADGREELLISIQSAPRYCFSFLTHSLTHWWNSIKMGNRRKLLDWLYPKVTKSTYQRL